MKKNCLFYLLLFICLFGFCNSVEAKEYTLDYSKKKTALDEYCYAAANSSYACKAYCKGKEITGTDRLGVTNGAGVTADIAFMNDHHCKGSKIEVKVNVDKPSDFNMKVNEMQIKDSLDSYCKSFSSSDFCKMYKEAEDSTTPVDNGEGEEDDVICSANKLSWLGNDEHPGFKHPSMSIRYNPSSGKVFVMSPAGDTNSDYFETGGKRYYFYSYSSKDNSKAGFEAFKNGLAEKYKAASSSEYSNLCNGIFVFCPLREDFNEWYAELASPDTKCDTINSAYLPYTQSVGGSSSGEIDIQLSGTETSYASELVQNEVKIKTCADLFQGDGDSTVLLDILKILVGTVKVLVPAILLGLGSVDFAKAIIAQDDNAIKKAQSRFIRRLIIAVAIFLIPGIIKALLDIAHEVWPDIISSSDDVFCGIL